MSELPFIKMHGLGNDFVVLDARQRNIGLGGAHARAIADRRLGIGCDQLLVIEPPENGQGNGAADVFMRIFNADGAEAGACGNGTRCVAQLVMAEKETAEARIETKAGVLTAVRAEDGGVVAGIEVEGEGLAPHNGGSVRVAEEAEPDAVAAIDSVARVVDQAALLGDLSRHCEGERRAAEDGWNHQGDG